LRCCSPKERNQVNGPLPPGRVLPITAVRRRREPVTRWRAIGNLDAGRACRYGLCIGRRAWLRREVFAFLPVLTLLVAACVDVGHDRPVRDDSLDEECADALARAAPATRSRRPAGSQATPGLRKLQGCGELADELREQAMDTMERTLDAFLQDALWARCADADDGNSDGGGEPPSGPSDYSQTNVQVPGVDEPDFVKNDGDHLYAAAGGGLRVIDAWPAPEAHVVAEVDIEGSPAKMFVDGDRALVYSSLEPESGRTSIATTGGWRPGRRSSAASSWMTTCFPSRALA
jgi:hypothetical protein